MFIKLFPVTYSKLVSKTLPFLFQNVQSQYESWDKEDYNPGVSIWKGRPITLDDDVEDSGQQVNI